MNDENTRSGGVLFALGAYGIWGFFPIYWKFLKHVDSVEILAHRMLWSLGFMLLVLAFQKKWSWIRTLRDQPKTVATYFAAASILAVNWGIYIWAVNTGFVVETALGYFINPLLNVALGALFLGERPRAAQWRAIALATCGVLYLTFAYGEIPWIALSLALTFSLYGLLKKKGKMGAIEGLSLETALLFLPALAFLLHAESVGEGSFGHVDASTNLLLAGSGIATALPLLFFAAAARRMTLTTLGFFQFLAPTMQFLIGVFIFHEVFTTTRFHGFALIWAAVAMFAFEGLHHRRSQTPPTPKDS